MTCEPTNAALLARNAFLESEVARLKQELHEAYRTIRYERHKDEIDPFELAHLRDEGVGCFEDAERESE